MPVVGWVLIADPLHWPACGAAKQGEIPCSVQSGSTLLLIMKDTFIIDRLNTSEEKCEENALLAKTDSIMEFVSCSLYEGFSWFTWIHSNRAGCKLQYTI